jgi:hypothetical protein
MPMPPRQELSKRIGQHQNPAHPFGPLDEGRINDQELSALFYCSGASLVDVAEMPVFLIGKAGAGKTAALRFFGRPADSTSATVDVRYLNFRVSDLHGSIYNSLKAEGTFETSTAAGYWEKQLLERMLDGLKDLLSPGRPSLISQARGGQQPIGENLKDHLDDVLTFFGARIIVTLDPLAQYDLNDNIFVHTVAGCWRAVGELNKFSERVRVITAIPFEVWSANSSAVVRSRLVDTTERSTDLVWDIFSLLRVAAYRFANFLRQHNKMVFERRDLTRFTVPGALSDHEINDFWLSFLPETVGDPPEQPLSYICRHTQQLPRQILAVLANVAVLSYQHTGGWGFFPEQHIMRGVAQTSEAIVEDVFSAFRDIYPHAQAAFNEVFRRAARQSASSVFSYQELETLWRENARPPMEAMNIYGFDEFIRMVQLMSIVGPFVELRQGAGEPAKVLTSHIVVDFDQQALIGPADLIALHPAFASALGLRQREQILPLALVALQKN